jgi:hypothetical protein
MVVPRRFSSLDSLHSIAAAMLLTWAAHETLVEPLFHRAKGVHRFVIEAPGPGDKAPGAWDNQIWIGGIIADGRKLRPDEIHREGNWTDSDGTLSHVDNRLPAAVSFWARSAVVWLARSRWSGRAGILADGHSDSIDLYCPRIRCGGIFVDLPNWNSSRWTWLPFVCVIGGAWLLLKPWTTEARCEVWLVSVLIAVHGLVWAVAPIDTVTDSLDYLPNFLQSLRGGYPAYFPPGYGLFQALTMTLPGSGAGAKIALVQHMMMVLSLLGLWRLVREWSPWPFSAFWLSLVTWLFPTLFLPQAILSENVALFAMVGALYFTCVMQRRGSVWAGFAAGTCVGFGTITRIVPIAASGPCVILLMLGVRRKTFLPATGALTLTAVMIVAAPLLWFSAHGNPFSLSSSTWRHMYNRVIYQQKLIDDDGKATRTLRSLLPGTDLSSTNHWDLVTLLSAAGAEHQTDALIRHVVIEAMRRHPLDYFLYTFLLAWRNLTADPRVYLLIAGGTPQYEAELETTPPLGYSAAAARFCQVIADIFGPTWTVLCWLAVTGVFVIRWFQRRNLLVALAWVPAGYIMATSFVEYFLPRYNVAITPFVAALGLLPFIWIARRRLHRSTEQWLPQAYLGPVVQFRSSR